MNHDDVRRLLARLPEVVNPPGWSRARAEERDRILSMLADATPGLLAKVDALTAVLAELQEVASVRVHGTVVERVREFLSRRGP